jgi:hypothetical protein
MSAARDGEANLLRKLTLELPDSLIEDSSTSPPFDIRM